MGQDFGEAENQFHTNTLHLDKEDRREGAGAMLTLFG